MTVLVPGTRPLSSRNSTLRRFRAGALSTFLLSALEMATVAVPNSSCACPRHILCSMPRGTSSLFCYKYELRQYYMCPDSVSGNGEPLASAASARGRRMTTSLRSTATMPADSQ